MLVDTISAKLVWRDVGPLIGCNGLPATILPEVEAEEGVNDGLVSFRQCDLRSDSLGGVVRIRSKSS